jgi:hypothetical protein
VERAVADLKISYPVVLDNEFKIWNAFHNRYWPAHYFFDRRGKLRHHHFGEGDYANSEHWIRTLLEEGEGAPLTEGLTQVETIGISIAPSGKSESAETYLGYGRGENIRVTPEVLEEEVETYRPATAKLSLNEWALEGKWKVNQEEVTLAGPRGKIWFRFRARDLNLVLGSLDKPARFRVRINGKPPGKSHGLDVDARGHGRVDRQRMYQLIRRPPREAIEEATFEVEFLDPGVQAFAFTFG